LNRISLFRCWLLCAALQLPLPASAQLEAPLPVVLDPKVETLLAPLSGMPTIQRADEVLKLEIEAGAAPDMQQVEAALIPSFGQVRPRISLGLPGRAESGVVSRLWPDRNVDRLEYTLPESLLPGLYDLEVSVAGFGLLSGQSGTDMQRRAVSIVAEYTAAPRVVILSDTHAGDPRAVTDVAEDAANRGEYMEVFEYLERSLGNPMNSERWAAFARVIHEINLVRPDFVLVTGDLTSLVHPAALPFEYEDAWRLLDRLEVPAYVAPGNHDLYAIDDYVDDSQTLVDGKNLWLNYFGPLYYSVDIGSQLHLASLNTFEWPRLEPFPVEDDFDTRAAGQITPEQFAWLAGDLRAYRAREPKGMMLSFAHHDPSWMQRRHAWMGENRLEARDLFAEVNLGVHFSGHTHEDRVARYYNGDVVETNGRPHVDGHVVQQLHLLKRDGNLDMSYSQEELGRILREPKHGPLFVSTTTVSSELNGDIWGLGGYWGWRLANLIPRDAAGGLDPADFGYPATDAFLQQHAERPENWTAEHAQFGLFSYPSFQLDQEVLAGNDGAAASAELRLTSRLLAELDVVPRLSVTAAEGQAFEAVGGEVLAVRYGNGLADVWIKARVPAEGQLDLKLQPISAAGRVVNGGRFGGALAGAISLLFAFAALWRVQGERRSLRL